MSVFAIRKFLFILLVSIIMISFHSIAFASADNHIYIENISYEENSGILIRFSSKTEFQLIQVDDKQFLLAVKDSIVAASLNTKLKAAGLVAKMSYDKMPGDVTALVFYTKKNIKAMASSWLTDGNSLLITVSS